MILNCLIFFLHNTNISRRLWCKQIHKITSNRNLCKITAQGVFFLKQHPPYSYKANGHITGRSFFKISPSSHPCFFFLFLAAISISSTPSKTVFSKFQFLSFLPLNSSVVNSTNCSDKISNGKLRDTYDATMPIDDEFTKEHSVARASKFRFIKTIIKWTL